MEPLRRRGLRRTLPAALAAAAGLCALFGLDPSSLLDDLAAAPSSVGLRRGLESHSQSPAATATAGSAPHFQRHKFETVILLGIFSDPTEAGARRRGLARDTMLRKAQGGGGEGGAPGGPFCPLHEYVEGTRDGCRVAYTFVVGAAAEEAAAPSGGQDGPATRPPDAEEDVTYLNVPEEDAAAKTAAWFRHAAESLSSPHSAPVDYVAKVGPSTVLSLELLLESADYDLPPRPHNSLHYGGLLRPNLATNGAYASGGFYFASPDLAAHAASKLFDGTWRAEMAEKLNEAKTAPNEDVLFGAAVFGHPNPIKVVTMAERVFWRSGLSDEGEWREYWERGMAKDLPRRERVLPMREMCAGWFDAGLIPRREG